MSNFIIIEQLSLTVQEIPSAQRHLYSLEEAARLSHIHPELLRYYCKLGLLGEEREHPQAELSFDDDCIYTVRRIEHYRRDHGVNRGALPLVLGLVAEIERLRAELQFLRDA